MHGGLLTTSTRQQGQHDKPSQHHAHRHSVAAAETGKAYLADVLGKAAEAWLAKVEGGRSIQSDPSARLLYGCAVCLSPSDESPADVILQSGFERLLFALVVVHKWLCLQRTADTQQIAPSDPRQQGLLDIPSEVVSYM